MSFGGKFVSVRKVKRVATLFSIALFLIVSANNCSKFHTLDQDVNSSQLASNSSSIGDNSDPATKEPAPSPLPAPMSPMPLPSPAPVALPATNSNQPTSFKTFLECSFDDAACGGKLYDAYKAIGYTTNVVQDPTAPFSGPNVVRSTRFANKASGGSLLTSYLPDTNKEVFLTLYWRTSVPFEGKNHGGNKLFFIRSKFSGTNGVFMYMCPTIPCSMGYIQWTTQTPFNLDQCGGTDIDACKPNMNNVPIKIGTWYKIEVHMKGSSCATCHDGAVRWWINGTLAGDYRNFAYGPDLTEWLWAETWDGSGPVNEWVTEAYHHIDHVKIGIP